MSRTGTRRKLWSCVPGCFSAPRTNLPLGQGEVKSSRRRSHKVNDPAGYHTAQNLNENAHAEEDQHGENHEGRDIFYSFDEGHEYLDEVIKGNKQDEYDSDIETYDSEDTISASDNLSSTGTDDLVLTDKNISRVPQNDYDESTYAKVDKLPEVSDWDGPVLIRFPTQARLERSQWRTDGGSEAVLGYNKPLNKNVIHFETDVFKGKAIIRFRGCPNEPTDYFKGRRRKQQWTVQGQFKHPIPTHQVVTGYEFKRKVVNIPAKFIVSSALRLIRNLAPTMKENIFCEKPYFYNPMLQTVQTLDVSRPGEEPDITGEFPENNTLLGGKFSTPKNISRTSRKHYFAQSGNGKKHVFETDLVYTFDFYEDKLDPSLFKLVLPMISVDVTKYLDSQPLSMIGKIWDPESKHNEKYLFNFELFHKSQVATRKLILNP